MPAPEWARLANTTIQNYIREEEVNTLRNWKALAMLESRGRISFNHSGNFMDWKVRYKRNTAVGWADTDTLTFARVNRHKTAQLEWRGNAITESVSEWEKLKNRGPEAIIKIAEETTNMLLEDMEEDFASQFYVDGNASGNSRKFHGLESFFSVSGANASQPIGTPNDTYAGLVCTLANYGGSWTGSWPAGSGDAHYDFWSPLIVDYTSAVATGSGGWDAATKTWVNTCREAIQYAIIHGQKSATKKGQLDMFILTPTMYRQLIHNLGAEEKLNVQRGDKQGLIALGFKDVVNVDGIDVAPEYGLTETVGYGLNFSCIELRSMFPVLYKMDDVDFDLASSSERYALKMAGNFRFNPRQQCKLDNVT